MAWKKLVFKKFLLQQTELTASFHLRHASERNSELFSIPRNGSERNSESLLLILFHVTEFFEHFSPLRNGSERNFENFLFRGTAGVPPEQTSFSVFRGIIFLSEIAQPYYTLYNYITTYPCTYSHREGGSGGFFSRLFRPQNGPRYRLCHLMGQKSLDFVPGPFRILEMAPFNDFQGFIS